MKNFKDEKNARTARMPFWPISVPQRVGYGLANFVLLMVWVSCFMFHGRLLKLSLPGFRTDCLKPSNELVA